MQRAVTQGEAFELPALDGYALGATAFAPPAGAQGAAGVVVVNPATSVPRAFYADFASFLAREDFVALTYDYRGIAGSRPSTLRGFGARMRDWGRLDMGGALAWAAGAHPDLPVLAVGHSAGGQLVGFAPGAERLAGLVGVAAQSGYWRLWPAPLRYRMWLNWHVLLPTFAKAFGRVPAWTGMGEDLPGGVAREWAAWCRSPGYLTDHLTQEERAAYARFGAPVLALGFSDDDYAPPAAVDEMQRFYPGARVARRTITPDDVDGQAIGHFGFFKKRFETTLWREVLSWLRTRAQAEGAGQARGGPLKA